MAERIVVASVQQRMHLPLTLDEYREDLRRFMRVAATKSARLVVFPELGGVMVAPPILRDFRSQLIKRQDRGRRKRASFWDRALGGLAGAFASLVGADFRRGLGGLLELTAQEIWDAYTGVFGALAREYEMVVVAPSAFLPDPVDGVIRNMSVVFDANGQMAGRQAKVVLHPADADLAQPGATWDVIATQAGRLGLILGSDVLYPEVGRLLAYQGAEMLVVQAACTEQTLYEKIRMGALARMQDNQLFTATSFLVGDNRLSRAQRTPFAGKSAIFAPQELSPRSNGVLVEMGNVRSEGVLAAEWDFTALRALWERSDTPVRQQLPLQQAGQVLASLYSRLQALPKVVAAEQLVANTSAPNTSAPETTAPQTAVPRPELPRQDLDDLVIIATATQRWPLPETASPQAAYAAGDNGADFVITPAEGNALAFPNDFVAAEYDTAQNTPSLATNGKAEKAANHHPSVTNLAQRSDVAEDATDREDSSLDNISADAQSNDDGSYDSEGGDDETDEMDVVPGSDRGR